ncbi:MAG: hypothetical protein JWN31_1400 [Frankiales bacterium]|nr:hypothetical protein [Frankiales bacterium]
MRRPYLIAEIGVNHDGDRQRAIELALGAAAAGFDAVKLQHWVTDELLAPDAPNADYQGAGDQHDLLAPLLLTVDDLLAVRDACARAAVDFGVTPDGPLACAEVLSTSPTFLKIGSGDADNPWLLEAAVETALPLIISTGMADDDEVMQMAARTAGHPDVTFLHCVSAYPTALRSANLGRLARLAELTGRSVGWSDHTVGPQSAIAAVALGATVVEKHITDDTKRPGPDHRMSMPLTEARDWVSALRGTAEAVGSDVTEPAESANRRLVRKALYPRGDLPAGHRIETGDLTALRPLLDGLPALQRDQVVGRRLTRPVSPSAPLRDSDFG